MKKSQQDEQEENELFGFDNLLDKKLSYSRLSSFDIDGPKALIKRKELSGEGIDMGGLIDLLLFSPNDFETTYYVYDGVKPTATLGDLTDTILTNFTTPPTIEEVVKLAKDSGYWSNIVKEETYIGKFNTDNFWNYIKAQLESKGKHVITEEQVIHAKEVVDVLKNHAYSKDIVAFPEEGQSKYVQYGIEYRYKNVILRGILDLLIVDHVNKTVQMVDLKTGAPNAEAFSTSFVKYRYYLQEAVYQQAFEYICKDLKLKGYALLPFKFLYISRYEKIPLVYTVPEKWHNGALNGFKTTAGYKYRGLNELIEDVTWHITNDKYSLSRDSYEKNGSIILNDDFIEV